MSQVATKPFIKADRRVLHHGSNLDREFPLRMMAGAGPSPAIRAIADLFVAASRAFHDSIWPALRHKMSNAIVGIREVNDCILKAFGFVAHIVPHCLNCNKKQWWSQVNYLLFGYSMDRHKMLLLLMLYRTGVLQDWGSGGRGVGGGGWGGTATGYGPGTCLTD